MGLNKKILIVEDENIIAKDIEQSLQSFGYEVAGIAALGEEALEKTQQLFPDLILMDIMLKGPMDGIETAEQIQNEHNTPIVYLTSYVDDATIERAKKTNPFGYIVKPFEEKELRATIEIAMQRCRFEEFQKNDLEMQRTQSVSRLAGGIAHDFNNLLMIIKSHGQLLLEGLDGELIKRLQVKRILEASDRAIDLTRRLLLFSKRYIAQPKVIHLNQIVLNFLNTLKILAGRNISIETHLDPQLKWIEADPLMIEQILTALLLNAREAMPNGGQIVIKTRNEKFDLKDPRVFLTFSDTGCGIDEKSFPHIFKPFFSTKENGKGLGLGLSCVYEIVRENHGAISVKSKLGEGTSFEISLPGLESQGILSDTRDAGFEKSHKPLEGITVLLVEDEPAVRDITARMLRAKGYRVLEASNGIEALQVADQQETPVDLLLTDVNMPRMGGKDLEKKLKAVSPETGVIFMSGYTDDSFLCQSAQRGDRLFLQKPFDKNELYLKIGKALEIQKNRKAN